MLNIHEELSTSLDRRPLAQAQAFVAQAELLLKRELRSSTAPKKKIVLDQLSDVLQHARLSIGLLAASEAR